MEEEKKEERRRKRRRKSLQTPESRLEERSARGDETGRRRKFPHFGVEAGWPDGVLAMSGYCCTRTCLSLASTKPVSTNACIVTF